MAGTGSRAEVLSESQPGDADAYVLPQDEAHHTAAAALHLVLDRDGVIAQEAPGRVIRTMQDWRWERGALAGLALLADRRCEVSIVTNQSGVASGAVQESELASLHDELAVVLADLGVHLLGIHACPHAAEDGCDCRKPRHGLVHAAMASSTAPPAHTVLVGDDLRDLDAAAAAGIRSVLVRTGKGSATELRSHDVEVFDDLHSAVLGLLGGPPSRGSSATEVAVRRGFEAHLGVVAAALELLNHDLALVADRLRQLLTAGGTVFAAGNGGSAADAQHFVAELVGRFGRERAPLRAVALGSDGVAASAMANDFGYEHVLARQLRSLARPGDAFVAISTSGDSPNVCAATRAARELGCWTVALTGSGGGRLGGLADVALRVPSHSTPRVQEVHSLCLHTIASVLDSTT